LSNRKNAPASARSRNSLESKSRHYHQANKKDPSDDESFLLARNLPKLELYNFIENYEKCLTFELIQSLKLLNVA